MHDNVKEKIWLQMKRAGGLSEDDRELYLFGFTQGAILLLNILTSLCIGFALDMLLEVVLYLLCFVPLRIFAGGYHAKTQLRCYIMSSAATILVLKGIQFLESCNSGFQWIALLVAAVVVWIFAPVQDANKPLSDAEQDKYRKRVRRLLVVLSLFLLVSYFSGKQTIPSVIMSSIYFISIVMLFGFIREKIIEHKISIHR